MIGLFYSQTTADSIFFFFFNTNVEKASKINRNLILVGDLKEGLLNINYHNLRDILLINTKENVINVAVAIYDYMPYSDILA